MALKGSYLMPGSPPKETSIEAILALCAGAYSVRTIAGYKADLEIFASWCLAKNLAWMPATPDVVAQFVDDQANSHRLSSIKRRLCAIVFAHNISDLPSPRESSRVRLAVRRAARRRPNRPEQARGLTDLLRRKIVAASPKTLAGMRDAALISVGYDTLCRSSELAAMYMEHVTFEPDGTAVVLIPRSKSDGFGNGRIAYLSPSSTLLLKRWLKAARVRKGPLFRGLHLGSPSSRALGTGSIGRIVKRAAARAGLDQEILMKLSGHSMRVGAAQDMMVAGLDAIAIMQAGGWKSANVVLRYVENASTKDLHARRWRLLGIEKPTLQGPRLRGRPLNPDQR